LVAYPSLYKMKEGVRVDRMAIVHSMIPLAVSGPLVIGVVVVGAVAMLVWLLRTEAQEEAGEETGPDQRTVTSQRSE